MFSLCICSIAVFSFFFFNDTATTEIYTLSLHDALPISVRGWPRLRLITSRIASPIAVSGLLVSKPSIQVKRSEEHTSELQSQSNLVCRLLLEKKKKNRESATLSGSNTDAPYVRTNRK